MNNTGLATLTYGGTNFLSYGDLRLDQIEFLNSDGSTSTGSTSNTVSVDLTNQVQTRTYGWGTIAENYSVAGNRLKVSVMVTNRSSLPIKGLLIEPLGVQFPSTISEFAAGYPLMSNSLGQPAVQMLTFTTGAMLIADDDVTKPLLLGFPSAVSSANSSVPIALVTDRVGWYCGCFPTINRPIAAGASDTFNFSLRFGPTGSTDTSLAPDVFQGFAAAYPSMMPGWPDHRPVGSVHLSTSTLGLSGWNTNPRGYLSDPTIDVTTPAGVAAFQQRMLSSANYDISLLQNMNAQGIIAWDLEGQQFGPYIGDPTQLATLAPEMYPIVDQYLKRFTDAGFRLGVTIRPQQAVVAPDLSSVQQNFLTDPTQLLLSKAQYAHDRWGATLFYVDSNVKSWTDQSPIDAGIFKALQAAMPDSIFFPEHTNTQYWAYTAGYLELLGGFASTPSDVRFTYPNAFSLIYTADGDIQGNFDKLVSGVQQGDVLLYRTWFDDEPANQQIQSIYRAAGATATSVTISVNPTGPSVALGQSEQFATTIAGTTNQQVTWSIAPGGAGTISQSGLYTAPSAAPAQPVTIRAASVADPTKIASVSIPFLPYVGVSIYQQGAVLTAGQTQQFSATVVGTSNQQVTWSVLSGPGSITPSGLYTAPSTISAQQMVTVKATSAADPTRSATANFTLQPSMGVAITPLTTSLSAGGTQQFTATVTGNANQQVSWSILSGGAGTISASGFYTAPSSITTQQVVNIKATSTADATQTATATVTLTPAVSISLNPLTASLTAGQTQQFTPTLTGTSNQQVTWSIVSGGAGTISTSGLYTAPAPIANQQTVTVQATSAADTSKVASATVTLNPTVAVSLNPLTASLTASQTQQFTPTVTGTSNQQVTWSIVSGGAGTISTSGLYTAPASITTQQSVTVQATSAADATKVATATVTLNPTVAVSLNPLTASLTASQTQQFTPSLAGTSNQQVTWSIVSGGAGTISTSGLYTAPASITTQQSVTVQATSVADATKSATATVTLNPTVAVSLNPLTVSLASSQTQQFTPTVTGTSNQQVTWSMVSGGAGTISTSGLYTAPASIANQQTVTVQATSVADATKSATATVTLNPTVAVSLNPLTASLAAGQTQQFTPTLTGTSNQQVTWSIVSGGAGTISTSGLYTAPASIAAQQSVTVKATSVADATKSATATVTLTPPAVPTCGGPSTNAFTGCYFNDISLGTTGGFAFSRVDPQINFDWSANGPGGSLGASNYSVKWQGNFTFNAGSYMFTLSSDDGSRLYIDGKPVIDDWSVHAAYTITQSYTMTAGTHLIELDYFQAGGGATANLTWAQPPNCGTPSNNAFTGCYYNDITLGTTGGLAFSRVDPQINFNWNNASPGGSLGLYNYSVRWQGNFNFNAGPYTFTLATDDGSRLYVDGQLIIDDWSTHAAYNINQTYTMTAGTHLIELDYFQANYGATATLTWAGSQTQPQPVAISVSPTTAALSAGQTQQFAATVTGSTNQQVTWSILSGGVGTISSSGLYGAPSSIASAQNVTVQAVSQADPTKSATASVTLTPPVINNSCGGPGTGTFTGCYFNDITLGTTGGLAFTRTDPQINFNWNNSSPGGSLGLYNYSVRWQGNFTFNAGAYTFTLATDDGSRLYVDGQLVIDDWSVHAAYTINQTYTMTAGTHLVELDYFQAGGGATASLSWAGAQSQPQVGISVNPTSGSLSAGQTQQFTATVTGTTNQQVTWSLLTGVGTVSSTGLYTAPSSLTSAQTATIRAVSAADPTKTASATLTLSPPAVNNSCGGPSSNAFTGCYYGDVTLGTSAGLAFSRVDPQINFDWSANGPGGNLGTTNYSVKWQGNFTFGAGNYIFTLATDDGSRLYVDGHLVIDDWSTHSASNITQSYAMTAGTHLIELDYFQAGGGASANLSWAQPPNCGPASTNAFTGCYFADTTLGTTAGIAFSRVDPQINFNWTGTTPGGNLGGYNYSVRWQGNFTFNAGPYAFTLTTDDGSRLYVDGQLVIDNWSVHPAFPDTQTYTMTAGTHLVEVDYYQGGGDASASLTWSASH